MQYRKFVILVFSIILTAVAFWSYKTNEWAQAMPLTAVVTSEGHVEELTCWKDQWNDYCFFLPGYADPSEVQIYANTDDEIWIGDHMLTKAGLSCDHFRMNETYGMARFGLGNQYDGVIRFVQSGNVPTLYVDVASGNMEYIHRKKGNEESGTMRLYTVDGDLSVSGSIESIKGRGNATWEWSKKPYSLTLAEPTDLLGMGQAQRWILLANATDRSSLKNKTAYDLAKAAGMAFSPDCQWVDLYLNGEYVGLYLLCERNEVHPQRVDIALDNSFLVSRELESRLIKQEYPYVSLKLGSFRIHYSTLDQTEVEGMWKSVENALLAENGIDPVTGKYWTELIDLDSWVEKYLMEEITANWDAGYISQFFYYDGTAPSGKIYAGPVWDMDNTLGVDDWRLAPPNTFAARSPICLGVNYSDENYSDVSEYSMFYLLYQKEEFYHRIVETYQHNFRPALLELLNTGMDRYVQEISQALLIDEIRWHTGAPEDATQKATEVIKTFLEERISFLDSVWIAGEEFCDVVLFREKGISEAGIFAWFAVRPGECLPEIPTENGEWYVCGSDEPFDVTQPIYESVKIYLKEKPILQEPSKESEGTISFAVLLAVLTGIIVIDQRLTSCVGKQNGKSS